MPVVKNCDKNAESEIDFLFSLLRNNRSFEYESYFKLMAYLKNLMNYLLFLTTINDKVYCTRFTVLYFCAEL